MRLLYGEIVSRDTPCNILRQDFQHPPLSRIERRFHLYTVHNFSWLSKISLNFTWRGFSIVASLNISLLLIFSILCSADFILGCRVSDTYFIKGASSVSLPLFTKSNRSWLIGIPEGCFNSLLRVSLSYAAWNCSLDLWQKFHWVFTFLLIFLCLF